MDRRRFLLTSLATLVGPLAAEAQQARVFRIGVVIQGGAYSAAVEGLRHGLKELGLEEGKQVVFLVRDVKGDLNAVEAVARRLEGEKVDLIWALATSTSLAVKRATNTVPIVFYAGTDPVVVGLVASFQKPGGRCTGVHGQFSDLTAKRLELLREMSPRARRVLAIYNPNNPAAQRSVRLMRDAARQLKVELVERPVASVDEMRAALHALRPGEVDAIGYVADAMVTSQAQLVIETANARRLPTIFQDQESVEKGALASYGESYYMIGRHTAKLIHRVLLGANPRDLPVEQLDRFHLVINLKTAKALGITIPPSLLLRADQVIE